MMEAEEPIKAKHAAPSGGATPALDTRRKIVIAASEASAEGWERRIPAARNQKNPELPLRAVHAVREAGPDTAVWPAPPGGEPSAAFRLTAHSTTEDVEAILT